MFKSFHLVQIFVALHITLRQLDDSVHNFGVTVVHILHKGFELLQIARSKGLTELAQAVVASARVEVDYVHALKGAAESPFLEAPDKPPAAPRLPSTPQSPLPTPETAQVRDPLAAGPAPDHPWRTTVHTLRG